MRCLVIFVGFFIILFTLHACQNGSEIEKAQFYTNGQALFRQNCQNCHGKNGEGLGLLYPPLTDTAFIKNNRKMLACLIKYGSEERMEINGKSYDESMPANYNLTAQEIAYILTYIGNSFNNSLGLISKEEVDESLKACVEN